MIPNNASREGTHIDPPTGAYEVYTYDRKSGTATLHLACGDDHGRAALAMRKAPGTACIARGGVVTSLASGTPANLVAGLKAAVKVAHASSATSAAPAATPRPVEPPAAPVAPTTTAKPAEEPMPTPAAPSCAKCSKYPVALTTAKTHAGTEQWCAHCRRVDAMRRNGTAFGRHAKAVAKAVPAPKASAKKPAAVEVNRPVSPEGSAVVVEATASDFAAKVRSELDAIGTMLIAKNSVYGNSALAPVRVFSRASTEEQLLVRIDDKLSRLARGAAAGEDVVRDLVGYLVLLLIARRS
jgi:hypothetical protein